MTSFDVRVILAAGVLVGTFLIWTKLVIPVRTERKLKKSYLELSKIQWRRARRERLSWKARNPYSSFYDPDYQELWELELGAEAEYWIRRMGWCNSEDVWTEYFQEQAKAHKR